MILQLLQLWQRLHTKSNFERRLFNLQLEKENEPIVNVVNYVQMSFINSF